MSAKITSTFFNYRQNTLLKIDFLLETLTQIYYKTYQLFFLPK